MKQPEIDTDICMGYALLDEFAVQNVSKSDSGDYYAEMIQNLKQSMKTETQNAN